MSPRARKGKEISQGMGKINLKFMPVHSATRDGSADEQKVSLGRYVRAPVTEAKENNGGKFRRIKKSSLPRIDSQERRSAIMDTNDYSANTT